MYIDQHFVFGDASLAHLLEIALRLDLPPGPGGSRMADFAQAEAAYQQVTTLRAAFPNPWVSVTVIALEPSAQIVAHCDQRQSPRRYHIPLQQNPGCWSFHAGTWQQLETGRIYRMDPAEEHGAVNWGATRRLQLILDEQRREG